MGCSQIKFKQWKNSMSDELTGSKSVSSYKILSLDGGGAKGFYTLGVLKELDRKSVV